MLQYLITPLFILSLLIAGTSNISYADEALIKSVTVESTNPDFNTWTQEILRSFHGKSYSPDTLSKIRERTSQYWSRSDYFTAEIESLQLRYDNVLIVKVKNPTLYDINFLGVSGLISNDLYAHLNLAKFSTTNPSFQYELAQKIKSFYLTEGYARAEVKFNTTQTNPHRMRITFEVNEGPKVRINSIRFIGQFSNPSDFYENQILKLASPLIRSGFYNRNDFENAIENMLTDMWNRGFLKAQAQINRVTFSRDRSRVDIYVLFYEGVQTYLKNIEYVNNTQIPDAVLREIVRVQTGQPLALADLEIEAQRLIDYYMNQGFLQMRLENYGPQMIEYSVDFSEAVIRFEISEGPQIIAQNIVIEGLDLTREYVVRNELEFSEGQILTREMIQDSQERLYLTGLFRDVQIRIEPETSDDPNRLIRIRLLEREPGLFNVGIGAHNERGLTMRGFLGVSYNNLLGTARTLSTRLEGQYNLVNLPFLERSIQAYYLEPYIFGTRTRGRIGLTRSILITDYNNSVASEANRTTYTLEQNLTPRLLAKWQVFEITTFRDFEIQSNVETNNLDIGATSLGYEYDLRDHPFVPSKGIYTQGYLEFANPAIMSSPWVQYYKSQINWNQYHKLIKDRDLILALGVRLGHIWTDENPDSSIPYDKVGFFMGGQSNLRGFTLNETFPNNVDLGGNNYRLSSSATMRLFKAELRIPIWQSVGTALFYDTGDINFSGDAYRSGWRASAGIAFRYNTPVGAVSLEYAWKLPPDASRGESPSTLHFAIGTF